eukprot:CAMPEP_0173082002 /NCGR_PEP_ID=MMETSP1102-20130122/17814_1 /TAXON_ID=49646 /ORGANISM="Geminigera sp., Strain Caron Lab Isolate" /LENGTH=558 /DNA_ID=CAMNT_0013957101 /DNA_START=154 /DNA_END=1830 /DNA_ORIENTATION=+
MKNVWLHLPENTSRLHHNKLRAEALHDSLNNTSGQELRDSHKLNVSNKSELSHAVKARRKVLSFSLYGASARYTTGAIENAKLHKLVYPGWTMLVYHDASVPAQILSTLKSYAVQLYDMSNSSMNKMSWRFKAGSHPYTERFCCRDIDARLSLREKFAVDEWIESGKRYHVMRDHPSHSWYAMSGGMWCASAAAFPFIARHLNQISSTNAYLDDMNWLNERIWKEAVKDVLQHDSFSCDKFGGGLPFPSLRIGWQHVGSVYINGEMRQGDVDILKRAKNPWQCTSTLLSLNGTNLVVNSLKTKDPLVEKNTQVDVPVAVSGLQFPALYKVLYILNIPGESKCKHKSDLHPLVCISTSKSGPNIVKVDVLDNWSQLGRRLLLALPQISSKYNASWYFKVDLDTAVDSKRLELALHSLSPDVEYIGQVYSFHAWPKYASGGAGYGMRHSALEKMHTAKCPLIPSSDKNYEDVTVGNCLYKHGVSVVQLDGLYGDNVKESSALARGVLKYPNHVFPINTTIPILTIHKSDINCIGSTVNECLLMFSISISTRGGANRSTGP